MKKLLKILGYVLAGLILLLLLAYLFVIIKGNRASTANQKLLGEEAKTLVINGESFRDLNKNGQIDPYEDHRQNIDTRIEDLISQMNLEEKAGLLFITMTSLGKKGKLNEVPRIGDPFSFILESNSSLVAAKKMNHFNVLFTSSAIDLANWSNNMQKMAERTRLGIPVTIATDPRHGVSENPGASIPTTFFSKWCSPLGFGAIGDTLIMREFADIARQEYLSVGLRLALHPMADLATEPRWGRINGTFGEDAELSASLTKAYILGFQGDSLTHNSVACMTKHFSGGGPQKDGEDAHFPYGADQAYPGNNFDYHLIPFEKGAFEAKTAQIMPYYGIPVGQTSEDVAFAFNKDIITGLLRDKYQFEGVICTDWGLITDSQFKPAAAWGVEHLSEEERALKIFDAGCDMFGGEARPELVINLVNSGAIDQSRLDASVRRILRDKFLLGLFDNPYIDITKISTGINPLFIEKGKEAQRRSLVLLKNEENILPLDPGTKIFAKGFSKEIFGTYDKLVRSADEADVIVLKIPTPYEPRSKYLLERFFHQGRLNFTEKQRDDFLKVIRSKPTITVITTERPPVIPDINKESKALIADFQVEDDIIMDLILGKFNPTGKLPIEFPSSAEAVLKQKEDLPYDSDNPLYEFGHGLEYQ